MQPPPPQQEIKTSECEGIPQGDPRRQTHVPVTYSAERDLKEKVSRQWRISLTVKQAILGTSETTGAGQG